MTHIGKGTLDQLTTYSWPDNVRELQNVIKRTLERKLRFFPTHSSTHSECCLHDFRVFWQSPRSCKLL
jgi:transcriptional regulator with GAF, ATPase, and Fis domain